MMAIISGAWNEFVDGLALAYRPRLNFASFPRR
jgi:hypothetical protein